MAGSLEVILDDLERANPPELSDRRRTFRSQAKNISRLLDLRSELVVASSIARNGFAFKFSRESPDLVCRTETGEIGVEATTRARDDLLVVHDRLEERLSTGPDVAATIRRTEDVFKVDQGQLDALVDAVAVAAATGSLASVSVPGLPIAVQLIHGVGLPPFFRVSWNSTLDAGIHWTGVSRELANAIAAKAGKTYAVPTIAAVDVSRLGDMEHWLLEPPSPRDLVQYVDPEALGSLVGAAVIFAGNLGTASMEVLADVVNPRSQGMGEKALAWFRRATHLSRSLSEQLENPSP